MVAQSAAADGIMLVSPPGPGRLDLQFLRASGLAQVRLQLAVLSGNRRRALEQIDRLVALDKLLEQQAEGRAAVGAADLHADLAGQRLAIASEKLALTSQVALPRLEPAFGSGMGAALDPEEPVEIVEDAALKKRFATILVWAFGFLVLCLGVAAAAVAQL